MTTKISTNLRRSLSAPELKESNITIKMPAESREAKTVFSATTKNKSHIYQLKTIKNFIDNRLYNDATNYISRYAKLLSKQDLTNINNYLTSVSAEKKSSSKIINWVKYYAGATNLTSPDLNNLQKLLKKQYNIKHLDMKKLSSKELAKANFLPNKNVQYLESFEIWLQGSNELEMQKNMTQWHLFTTACKAIKEHNIQALENNESLIAFQGLHPTTNKLFLNFAANLQDSKQLMSSPQDYANMNSLIINCIDRVAPDLSSDVDSYTSLHDKNDGANSRLFYNVQDFHDRISLHDAATKDWLSGIQKYGSLWHSRGTATTIGHSSILQSFEWVRNDDSSLTRNINMCTYLNPKVLSYSLDLRLPPMLIDEEIILIRLLKKLGNTYSEDRGQEFDNWLHTDMKVPSEDKALKEQLKNNKDRANITKYELLEFLDKTDRIHARFIYNLQE